MKKIKKFFKKKSPDLGKNHTSQQDDKDNNIDRICRFKLMFNHATGKYEKVFVYQLYELSEDEA